MAEVVVVQNVGDFRSVDNTVQNPWAQHDVLPCHVSFCHWVAPQYGSTGEAFWQKAAAVVAFAMLIWGIYEQLRIFNLRYDIAKAYADLASEQWGRFVQRYMPLEGWMAARLMAEGPVKPDCAAAGRRY